MKILIVSASFVCISAVCVFAQADLVKKKAKDLKRDVETQQTNQIRGATNAPAKK
ncbi:MAG TPA: hypothetical protein VNT99_08505 [Methylomirabilota bacterium]|nr:hypothetical protein [Methylomirabilota bacterium]